MALSSTPIALFVYNFELANKIASLSTYLSLA